MTATVPRILATILNGTIVAGMVVLLHRCRTAQLVPAAHLYISYAKDIFWHRSMTGLQTGFATADMRTARARWTRSRSVFRNAYLLARAMRAKFALGITFRLQTRGDSPLPLIDVRVQWSTRHQDNAVSTSLKVSFRTQSCQSSSGRSPAPRHRNRATPRSAD